MKLTRLHRQDGMIRESVLYLAIFVVAAVIVFDGVSVTLAHLGVRQNAIDAADSALSVYVQNGSTNAAYNEANTLLKLHGSTMIPSSFRVQPSPLGLESTTIRVGARRTPHTYLFHYLQGLPWGVGSWFKGLLHPSSVQSNT